MAKKAQTKAGKASGRFAGQKFAFVGDLGYYQYLSMFTAAVIEAGGKVVDADLVVPDFLVVGQGRGGKTPGQATALLKKHPTIQTLDVQAFCNLALPSRDELAELIRNGRMDVSHPGSNHGTLWHVLEALQRLTNSTIDLSGESFRGIKQASGAHLEGVRLDNTDFRDANLEYAHLPTLRSVKLDNTLLDNAYLQGAENCSFRNAQMDEVWFYDVHRPNQVFPYASNDFTGAKIRKANGRRTNAAGNTFRDTDLSESEFNNSDFTGADLTGANLTQIHFQKTNLTDANLASAKCHRADLRDTQLINADLRNADLREAVLTGADLTGAIVDGADFQGANLSGAKLDGVDTAKAKNLVVQKTRPAGPKMVELARLAAQSQALEVTVELELDNGERVRLHAYGLVEGNRYRHGARSSFFNAKATYGENESFRASTFEQGMLDAAARWSRGTVCLDTVTAKGSKCPLKGKPLKELAVAAWSEACGIDSAEVAKKAAADTSARQSLQDTMVAELKGGAAGIKKWNARPKHERAKIAAARPVDLSGCDLSGADFEDCDLRGANFQGANLKKAILEYGDWDKANFSGADFRGATFGSGKASGASFENAILSGCTLSGLTLRDTNFRGVDLTKTKFDIVDLRGADLSAAKLSADLMTDVSFDDKTLLPKGFVPTLAMVWKGPGQHPAVAKKTPRAKKAGAMTFDDFLKALANHVIDAKLKKATSMLKAERFQLFAEVKDDSLIGIVKSQTDKDLVYSCRLCSDGAFSCCTQNLKPCGGLQGSLCKHLLVLIVGLTKAGKLDPATVDSWIDASKSQKPAIDKDILSETFIRYKGAEAGEIDWRPTETIPEDFYAM
jgi:uncharacterized protein YjbI with pentapeptide repeats